MATIEIWKKWPNFWSKTPQSFKTNSFSWQYSFDIVPLAYKECCFFWNNFQDSFVNQLWPKNNKTTVMGWKRGMKF